MTIPQLAEPKAAKVTPDAWSVIWTANSTDGRDSHSMAWTGDVVGAMVALIAHPKAHGEVFNIGHTEEISIYELAVLVRG